MKLQRRTLILILALVYLLIAAGVTAFVVNTEAQRPRLSPEIFRQFSFQKLTDFTASQAYQDKWMILPSEELYRDNLLRWLYPEPYKRGFQQGLIPKHSSDQHPSGFIWLSPPQAETLGQERLKYAIDECVQDAAYASDTHECQLILQSQYGYMAVTAYGNHYDECIAQLEQFLLDLMTEIPA